MPSRKGSLDACTVLELKAKAAKRGIKVTGLNKAEIIAKLRGKQSGNGFFGCTTDNKVDCVVSEIENQDSRTGLIYPVNTRFNHNTTGVTFVLGEKHGKDVRVYGKFITPYTTNDGFWRFNEHNGYILPSELEANYTLAPPQFYKRQNSH